MRPDGRVVMQRTANPRRPVRFRFRPPNFVVNIAFKFFIFSIIFVKDLKHKWSPVAQLVEQVAVNHWVAGSSPARGANKIFLSFFH